MILITDGTNLIGSHLLYKLLIKNETVKAIYNNENKLIIVKKVFSFFEDTATVAYLFAKIKWIKADITDIPSLETAFKNVSFVYHTACVISFRPKDYFFLRKVNIDGTANIVNACIANNIEKICHVSSLEALGKTTNGSDISEETNWNPEAKNNEYAITKYGAEMEVWRGSQEGLKTIIINPGIILGAGFPNSISHAIFQNAYSQSGYYTEGKTGFVNVEDVVSILIKLMNSTLSNEQYILVSDNLSFKELHSKIAIALKKKPSSRKAGLLLLKLKVLLRNKKSTTLNTFINVSQQKDTFNSAKIKTALDYNFILLKDTIQNICDRTNF